MATQSLSKTALIDYNIFPKDPLIDTNVRVIRLSQTELPQELSQSDITEQEIRAAEALYRRRRLWFAQTRPGVFAPRQGSA